MRTIKPASEALAVPYEKDFDKNTQSLKQCTLKHSVELQGMQRRGSKPVLLRLRPAPIDTGIVFQRVDLIPSPSIAVDPSNVNATDLQLSLVKKGIEVRGIEHLMSALAGLGIDNLCVDINHTTVPVLDGSAEPFVFAMQSVGLTQQPVLKRFIRIIKKVQLTSSSSTAWVSVEPCSVLQMHCALSSEHERVPFHQEYSIVLSPSLYAKSLSRARHVPDRIPMSDRRYENEYIRHHMLDTIGDLYMLGYGILGSFRSYNTNHVLNNRLIQTILANLSVWEMVEYPLQTSNTAEPTYY